MSRRIAKLAFWRVSVAFRKASRPQVAIMLVPPEETNGKVTPVSGRMSTEPKTLSMVWNVNRDIAEQAAML